MFIVWNQHKVSHNSNSTTYNTGVEIKQFLTNNFHLKEIVIQQIITILQSSNY